MARAQRMLARLAVVVATVLVAMILTGCGHAATTGAPGGALPMTHPPADVTAPSAGVVPTLPARWIAVSVATLWVRPGITRPVDAPALTNPAHPGRWVADMTVDQKRWLVGRLETQALYGTKVYVLATSGTWTKVAVSTQPTPRVREGYPGWLPTVQLTRTAPAGSDVHGVVRYGTASLWRDAASIGERSGRLMWLSYDTRLPVVSVHPSYVEVALIGGRHAVLRRHAVALRYSGTAYAPTRATVIAEARRFLGLQYLWAGTSGFGYDCSGFTYSVFHRLGMRLPRDADRQAVHGTPVAKADLMPGDLVFVRNSSGAIVHVAIYYGLYDGVRSVIHAPRTGQPVQISPLSSLTNYAGARRYLSS